MNEPGGDPLPPLNLKKKKLHHLAPEEGEEAVREAGPVLAALPRRGRSIDRMNPLVGTWNTLNSGVGDCRW